MELGGTTLGTGYDHLNVLGTASLAGTLDVVDYGGFMAGAGQSFDLFNFAHETGTFSAIYLPTLGNGLAWNTSGLYTIETISVTPTTTPEPAPLAVLAFDGLALLRRQRKS